MKNWISILGKNWAKIASIIYVTYFYSTNMEVYWNVGNVSPFLPPSPPPFHSSSFQILCILKPILKSRETGNSLKSPADGGKVPFPNGPAVWWRGCFFPSWWLHLILWRVSVIKTHATLRTNAVRDALGLLFSIKQRFHVVFPNQHYFLVLFGVHSEIDIKLERPLTYVPMHA